MAGREGKENVVFIMKKSLPVRVTIFYHVGCLSASFFVSSLEMRSKRKTGFILARCLIFLFHRR